MDAARTWLSTPPTTSGILDWFGVLYVVVFGLGFVLSAYLAGPAANAMWTEPAALASAKRWATIGLGVFGVGLFFFGVRALQINPLSFGAPFWMVASVIALLVTAARCRAWWRDEYPRRRTVQGPDQNR